MNTDIEIKRQLVATIEGLKTLNTELEVKLNKERERNTKLSISITASNHSLDLFIQTSQGKIRQRLQEVSKLLNLQA